jgi:hypothetical protein
MDGVSPYTHAPDGSVYPVFPAPENTLPVGQTSSESSTTLASDAYALPQQCQPLPYEERVSFFQWQPNHDVHTGSSPQHLVSHIPMTHVFSGIVHAYTRSHNVNAKAGHGLVSVLVTCFNQQVSLGISGSS